MFQRFRLQRSLRNSPTLHIFIIEDVPASRVNAVIRDMVRQGWTFLRAEETGRRGNEALYTLYFGRETNKAASEGHRLARHFPPEAPPSTPGE